MSAAKTPPASVTDEWIADAARSLYVHHRFIPDGEPFLLDPAVFDSLAGYKEQVLFLIKRHHLPYLDLDVYMHADLAYAGLAQYPVAFDVSELEAGKTLLTVDRDGTYSTLDLSNPTEPIFQAQRTRIGQTSRRAVIFLNQAYIGQREILGATIAHEVAHLYLYHRGVHAPTLGVRDPTLEFETDIAMFVMGLGLLALRAGPGGSGYLSHRQALLAHEHVLAFEREAR